MVRAFLRASSTERRYKESLGGRRNHKSQLRDAGFPRLLFVIAPLQFQIFCLKLQYARTKLVNVLLQSANKRQCGHRIWFLLATALKKRSETRKNFCSGGNGS